MKISNKTLKDIKILGVIELLWITLSAVLIFTKHVDLWFYTHIVLGFIQVIQTVILYYNKPVLQRWRKFHSIYLVIAVIMACIPVAGWLVLLFSSFIVAFIYAILKVRLTAEEIGKV